MKVPKLSVIMPVYNSEAYLRESIDSILNQTFTDFEFLICDDGSTDSSYEILSSYRDPRIRLFKNSQNLGIVRTCNEMIHKSRGEYISRHDSDDISLPSRFEKQINFLDSNPSVSVCGTNTFSFGDKNRRMFFQLDDEEIRAYMIINNPFCTSSVMIRNSSPPIFYDESLVVAEDYAYWFELSKNSKMANLPDHLLRYRWHSKNISQLKKQAMAETVITIRANLLSCNLSYSILEEESAILTLILDSKLEAFEELKILEAFLLKLLKKNEVVKYYKQSVLQNQFFHLWTSNCFRLKGINLTRKIGICLNSQLFNFKSLICLISKRNFRSFTNKYVN